MSKSKLVNGATPEAPIDVSTLPSVVGINFGNTYASIAVMTKEGMAECIANEDGERQIACAVSFFGEEMYIGNQAQHQLVKNPKNTIIGFRNLLGKKFSDLPQDQPITSAPVIQHPDLEDEPAYSVQVLQPAPTPLPPSTPFASQAASQAATPRSEPTMTTRILTVTEVTTLFIRSLVQSAEDFLGKKVTGAVVTVPATFAPEQRAALQAAAAAAGLRVLQLLDDVGALVTAMAAEDGAVDSTQLVVDLGQTALSLTLLSVRHGLAHVRAHTSSAEVNSGQIDGALAKFFAKDFTKKTKVPLGGAGDARADAKLRLALQHTKRTIAASAGAAACSVESLKDGLDYAGTINRLRFDMECAPVYAAVRTHARDLLEAAGVDQHSVDELVCVGGSASLPGLADAFVPLLREDVRAGSAGDPTTVLARGCALQAGMLAALAEAGEEKLLGAFADANHASAQTMSRTLGVLFPGAVSDDEQGLGGRWVPLVHRDTPVPARRSVVVEAELTESAKRVGLEVWQVVEGIKVSRERPPKLELEDGEDDLEEDVEEEVEIREVTIEKEGLLGALALDAKQSVKAKGRWKTKVEVQLVVSADGSVAVSVWEVGKSGRGEKASLSVGASK